MPNQAKWCLIHTKPKQEQTAAEHLRRQHYHVYLPMLYKRRTKSRKQTSALTPLFPRYLFVRLAAGIDDWGPIRSTKGVRDFVRFGTNPTRVPDELIDDIKAREDDNGLHHELEPELQRGDKIRLTDGPFSGCNAIFTAHRSKERVMILLDIIGKSSRVEVAANSIEKRD
jgi:transcriptional antiterminator RfaH